MKNGSELGAYLALTSQLCDVTLLTALQNKSIVCSSSWLTSSTIMRLHEYDNQGRINVKTRTKCTCSQIKHCKTCADIQIDTHFKQQTKQIMYKQATRGTGWLIFQTAASHYYGNNQIYCSAQQLDSTEGQITAFLSLYCLYVICVHS